jgi:5-methylcytosine-specific restriction endonuclease McrA
MTVEQRTKLSREEMVAGLMARDGTTCQYPGCGHELDFTVKDGPKEVTIDHWIPQSWAYEQGWTHDEVWDLSNLKLMEKKCNAKKGDLLPNEDGTIPEKKTRTFKYRRDARAQRPELCTKCNSGRNLDEDEWCNACGSGPQPARYPKWRQMSPKDCDHDLFFCWVCTIDKPELRRSVLDTLLTGGEGYE